MHDYLVFQFWYNVGKFGAIAVLVTASWLTRQKWWPHKHTGYVALSGRRVPCRRCGRRPAITTCTRCEHAYQADGRACPWCGPGQPNLIAAHNLAMLTGSDRSEDVTS